MRHSKTQFMKRIFKVAIFILGVLLVITGIISGSYALVLLPDGKSEYMPFVVISLLALIIGIYICVLAMEVPRYLAKTRKMSREEKVIENIKTYMKKGKSRIAAFTFLLVLTASTLIWIISLANKFSKTITPENIRLLNLFKLVVQEWHFALFTGFFIAMLIIEFAGFTKNKHRLTLCMWEKIQQLENEVKELKTHTQTDVRQVDEINGGDTVVN